MRTNTGILLALLFSACGGEPEPTGPWPELESGLDASPPRECGAVDELPDRLSDHPCFEGEPPVPGPSLIPYAVRAPLWSDGLDKARFLAVPEGVTMASDDAGRLELPAGTVLVKRFSWEGRRIETRLLSRLESGTWRMATYVWDEDGEDAVRTREGVEVELGEQTWPVPSEEQCEGCHTEAADIALGVTFDQLNRDLTYPSTGRTANQIATLVNTGLLDPTDLDRPDALPALPTLDDEDATDAEKARAYLHANCAHCHRPGSSGSGSLDLRFATPFELAGLCDRRPEFGDPFDGAGAIVVPGDAERSLLAFRLRSDDPYWRMPPLGTTVVDEDAVDVVTAWIDGLEGCE